MTRKLGAVAALMIVATVGLFIVGLAGSAPGALILSFLCTMPGAALLVGMTIGRASNEFQVVRKDRPVMMNHRQPGIDRRKERDVLS